MKRHFYILGETGSGKSEFIKVIVKFLLKKGKQNQTIIVIDPHAEFADQVAHFKEFKTGENLVYLSSDLKKGHTFCINPFEIAPKSEQVHCMAEALMKVFIEMMEADTTLSLNMKTILTPMISVLLKREGSTLLDLQRFMDDDDNQDLVEYAIIHSHPGQRYFFQKAFYKKKYTVTKEALYTKIQSLLNSEVFYNLTVGKSTVDLRELMNSRKTVIFGLPQGNAGFETCSNFGRFVVGMLKGLAFERQELPENERVPTFLCIDEFQNFISSGLPKILEETRKYKLHLLLAQQFFGQGSSSQLKETIRHNTAVKIVGKTKTSQADLKKLLVGVTEEDINKLDIGEFYIQASSIGILRKAFLENLAQKIKVTTSYLGYRHSMKPKHWQKVKAQQINDYYRPIKHDFEPVEVVAGVNPQEIKNASQNVPHEPLRPRYPVKPMY